MNDREKCKNGLVSTIIPVYNRAHLVREAIDSVLQQTYTSIEIIVVDDGSTDATPTELKKLGYAAGPAIRVTRTRNLGAGWARERGRRMARGEFIQYLDSDDRLLKDKFEKQVAALRERPDCDIAYGQTRLIDANGKELLCPYKWTDRGYTTLFPHLLVDRWWNTHTPLYRRSVCDAIGPWSDMRMSEDWEYEARIGALGTRLAYVPEVLSETRKHEAPRVTGNAVSKEMMRDIVRLLSILYPCAKRAGVENNSKEMRHFARWAFLEARRAGAAGLPVEARTSYELARQAMGIQVRDRRMQIYRNVARILGWSFAGRLACWLDKSIKGTPGPDTLKQAWT